MSRFKGKKTRSGSQEIPTTALPDIIFILLFFFMVVTVVKPSDLLVQNTLPKAKNLQEAEQKNAVITILIGKPVNESDGTEARVQIEDRFFAIEEIPNYVIEKKDQLGDLANKLTVVLKIDRDAEIGLLTDVEKKLREVNARRILYVTYKGDPLY